MLRAFISVDEFQDFIAKEKSKIDYVLPPEGHLENDLLILADIGQPSRSGVAFKPTSWGTSFRLAFEILGHGAWKLSVPYKQILLSSPTGNLIACRYYCFFKYKKIFIQYMGNDVYKTLEQRLVNKKGLALLKLADQYGVWSMTRTGKLLNGIGWDADISKFIYEAFAESKHDEVAGPDLLTQADHIYRKTLPLSEKWGFESTISTYKALAAIKHPPSLNMVGRAYYTGDSIEKNVSLARKLLEEAGDRGEVAGWVNRGTYAQIEKEWKAAFCWYEKAIEKRNHIARTRFMALAVTRFEKSGKREDRKKVEIGREYLGRSSERNEPLSGLDYYWWGRSFIHENNNKAKALIEIGIEKKDMSKEELTIARTEIKKLNELLEKGSSSSVPAPPLFYFQEEKKTESTEDKVNRFFREAETLIKSSEQRDKESAFGKYCYAAKNNHVQAQYQLSICYRDGRGTEKNAALAHTWLQKAAENNHPKAKADFNPQPSIVIRGINWVRSFCRSDSKKNRNNTIASVMMTTNKEKLAEADRNKKEEKSSAQGKKQSIESSHTSLPETGRPKRVKYKEAKPKPRGSSKKPDDLLTILNIVENFLNNKIEREHAVDAIKSYYKKLKNIPVLSSAAQKEVKILFSKMSRKFLNFIENLEKENSIDIFSYIQSLFTKDSCDIEVLAITLFLAYETTVRELDLDEELNWKIFLEQARLPVTLTDDQLVTLKQTLDALDCQLIVGNEQEGLVEPDAEKDKSTFEESKEDKSEETVQSGAAMIPLIREQDFDWSIFRGLGQPLAKKEGDKNREENERLESTPQNRAVEENKVASPGHALQEEKKLISTASSPDPITLEINSLIKSFQSRLPLEGSTSTPDSKASRWQINIPPIAVDIIEKIQQKGYQARLKGSRVYDPPRDFFEWLTRDMDFETSAPLAVVKEVFSELKLFNVREYAAFSLCVTETLLGQKIDVCYGAYLKDDLLGHDTTVRSKYADAQGHGHDPTGKNFHDVITDGKEKPLIFLPPYSKELFLRDAILILHSIYLMSKGYKLEGDDLANLSLLKKSEQKEASENAIKSAFKKLVDETPQRIWAALAKNFIRGKAADNFELLVKNGVWDVLFPHPTPIENRPYVYSELRRYFTELDKEFLLLRIRVNKNRELFPLMEVNPQIRKSNRHVYTAIVLIELFADGKLVHQSMKEIAKEREKLISQWSLINKQPSLRFLRECVMRETVRRKKLSQPQQTSPASISVQQHGLFNGSRKQDQTLNLKCITSPSCTM